MFDFNFKWNKVGLEWISCFLARSNNTAIDGWVHFQHRNLKWSEIPLVINKLII